VELSKERRILGTFDSFLFKLGHLGARVRAKVQMMCDLAFNLMLLLLSRLNKLLLIERLLGTLDANASIDISKPLGEIFHSQGIPAFFLFPRRHPLSLPELYRLLLVFGGYSVLAGTESGSGFLLAAADCFLETGFCVYSSTDLLHVFFVYHRHARLVVLLVLLLVSTLPVIEEAEMGIRSLQAIRITWW